jgi:hypothetical protein
VFFFKKLNWHFLTQISIKVRAYGIVEKYSHFALSLSLSLSLSFSRIISSSPRLSSSFDSRNDKQFHWIENSEFELIFSQRERVLKGFELERISIVKSLCPCSFSRDDDSSS